MIPERKCLECGDVLRGRADQKFCSDQCRNAYHNRFLGDTHYYIRRINRILRKNHTLLATLNTTGKTTVLRSTLVNMEFNFNYFTHSMTSRNGTVIYFCYDQGYKAVNGEKIKLIRQFLPHG